MKNILLGVNIDHVATLRQARCTVYPDPIQAAIEAEKAGADGITVHLREDRRHIQDKDVIALKDILKTRMNFEMSAADEIVDFALSIRPPHCCIVPERREELTTEGGLDVKNQIAKLKTICKKLADMGTEVSLFIDPDVEQIDATLECGASTIEIHTGHYTDATTTEKQNAELQRIIHATNYASDAKLIVNAGHGLNYDNVQPIAKIPQMNELNIGHAIIARAVFVGLYNAVREMKELMISCRLG